MELTRISTAGSVDDGKSTLIGRLLFDSHALLEDQIENILQASKKKNFEGIDYSLFTDGLRDERTQGITIDVAHLYFSSPYHKYIIADTPGHVQYTRNMITGMSNADIALILIDIKKGLNEQVKRHIFIALLLKIPKLIFCVNKMDLTSYQEDSFLKIVEEFNLMNKSLDLKEYTFIPISATNGDNVVSVSSKMPWYKGKSIIQEIEELEIVETNKNISKRIQVQCVINSQLGEATYRGYAGMISSGNFKVGEEITVLPIAIKATIKSIIQNGKNIQEAETGSSIAIELDHEIDISRGDMIAGIALPPINSNEITSTICWMHEQPLSILKKYILKIGTKETQCIVSNIISKYNNDFDQIIQAPKEAGINEIATISIKTANPIHFDKYVSNKNTGRFILIDPVSNDTVAAGIIE